MRRLGDAGVVTRSDATSERSLDPKGADLGTDE
jgi:hypothetical protein